MGSRLLAFSSSPFVGEEDEAAAAFPSIIPLSKSPRQLQHGFSGPALPGGGKTEQVRRQILKEKARRAGSAKRRGRGFFLP